MFILYSLLFICLISAIDGYFSDYTFQIHFSIAFILRFALTPHFLRIFFLCSFILLPLFLLSNFLRFPHFLPFSTYFYTLASVFGTMLLVFLFIWKLRIYITTLTGFIRIIPLLKQFFNFCYYSTIKLFYCQATSFNFLYRKKIVPTSFAPLL